MSTPPTVLLLPGLICDAQFWTARAALAELAPVKVAEYTGLSSIAAMAQKALSEVDGPLVVIGHSMGGRVALEAMRQAPQRIVGLALLNTGIHTRRPGEGEKRAVMVRLAYEQGMAALADAWVPPMVAPRRADDAQLLAPMKAMVLRATPQQHEHQIRALLDRPDPRDVLPRIACPTLVMVGRQDQWSPLSQHEEIASLIPGAKLVVIEDSGHMSQMEQPAATTAALVNWLRDDVLMRDRIPDTPLFDRQRQLAGYRLNKMAMGLCDPANRAAFKENEAAYLDRFGLTPEQKKAVMARDWREMVRLGGNVFFIFKISALDPIPLTAIGAHQAGMEYNTFLRERLGKKI